MYARSLRRRRKWSIRRIGVVLACVLAAGLLHLHRRAARSSAHNLPPLPVPLAQKVAERLIAKEDEWRRV